MFLDRKATKSSLLTRLTPDIEAADALLMELETIDLRQTFFPFFFCGGGAFVVLYSHSVFFHIIRSFWYFTVFFMC